MSKRLIIEVDSSTRVAAWIIVVALVGIGFMIGRWVG